MDNYKNHKPLFTRLLCGFFIFIVLLIFVVIPIVLRYKSIPLEDLHWAKPAGLIAIHQAKREGQPGILFLRLKDAKEQFIAGNWQVDFSNNGNAFLFSQSKPEIYIIEGGRRIIKTQLKDLRGTIASIQENLRQTYLALEIQGESKSTFCLVEKTGADSQPCQIITVRGTAAHALWNPKADQDLVLKTDRGEIYIQNAWEPKSESVSPESEPARYQQLINLFTANAANNPHRVEGRDGMRQLWRFANLIFIRDEKKGWSFARVPLSAKVGWVVDGYHLLVKTNERLEILEPDERRVSTLLEEPGISGNIIEYRIADFDQTL